ncbi:NUDIX hydrolase [Nocardia sp. XZ_19_385]|uniref:NUDIX hydrolase n=1 Tax=Nocardia sp. XZ_19_385 TaxID=2769488 RepID=UPI0018900591|nr:NUDIX domain-containing protein [Nocardia sp. XZ_19_385]
MGIQRPTARVILVDSEDRVLLFRFNPPAPFDPDPGWLTPGGGLDPGESTVDGAVRELFEETGYRIDGAQLSPVVAVSAGQWSADDGTVYDATDSYFFVRADTFEVDISGQEEVERNALSGHRWWALPELRATSDHVFPLGLAGLLERLLAGDIPDEPLRLPWR